MDKMEAQKRISKLRREIARLRDAYHIKNAPNVTDDVYDSLTRELKMLLQKYPEFEDKNSSENRVAGKPLDKFMKVEHKTRMLSLNDVFSEEELFDWEKRIKKLLPMNSIFIGVGVSAAIGISFGVLPARSASKMNPMTSKIIKPTKIR